MGYVSFIGNTDKEDSKSLKLMKISDLCKMVQESVSSGRYPLETEIQKKFAPTLQVTNKSDTEDLKGSNISIETRVHDLFVINNYVPSIVHLPGVIELDVIDSFKMICRRFERFEHGIQL